jgi:hypothetical protein
MDIISTPLLLLLLLLLLLWLFGYCFGSSYGPTTIHHGHSTRTRGGHCCRFPAYVLCTVRSSSSLLLVPPRSSFQSSCSFVHSFVLPGERPKHRTFSSVSSIHPMCSLLCWLFVRCFVVGPIRCFGCCCCCFVVAKKFHPPSFGCGWTVPHGIRVGFLPAAYGVWPSIHMGECDERSNHFSINIQK